MGCKHTWILAWLNWITRLLMYLIKTGLTRDLSTTIGFHLETPGTAPLDPIGLLLSLPCCPLLPEPFA